MRRDRTHCRTSLHWLSRHLCQDPRTLALDIVALECGVYFSSVGRNCAFLPASFLQSLLCVFVDPVVQPRAISSNFNGIELHANREDGLLLSILSLVTL